MAPITSIPEPRRTPYALVVFGSGAVTGLHLGLLHMFLWRNPRAVFAFVAGGLIFAALSFTLMQWVFPRFQSSSRVRLIAMQAGAALVAAFVVSVGVIWLAGFWLIPVPPLVGTPTGVDEILTITPAIRQAGVRFYALLPLVPTVMMTVLGYNFLWRPVQALEMRQRELADLAAAAQLAALRAQINPHFLFNSLNSIAQLISVDPTKAEACVERLAEIFRYVLRRSEQDLVPLAEELAVAEAYLEIEQARFGDRLQVEKRIDAVSLRHRIPSLILQPLVENAVKHGLSRKIGAGTVRIGASTQNGLLTLTVDDDGVGIPAAALAEVFERGVGLRNLRARMERLYGPAHLPVITSAEGSGTSIRLELPLGATA